MRKEDIVKLLMIYNNDFSTKFKNSLNKKKKIELEKELQNIDKEILKKNLFKNEEITRVYQNAILKRKIFEEDKAIIDKYKECCLLKDNGYYTRYVLYVDVADFIEDILPLPKNYYLNEIKCDNLECNYAIKEHLEIIRNLNIELTSQSKVKKTYIKKFKELTKVRYNDTEIEWLLYVGFRYFENNKKVNLRKFYDFFFKHMLKTHQIELFKLVMPYMKNVRVNFFFYDLHNELYELAYQLDDCVSIENIKEAIAYRKEYLFYFNKRDFDKLEFKDEFLKVKEYETKEIGGIFNHIRTFDFYEEYIYCFLKGYLNLLSILGFIEIEKKESDLVVDIFYDDIYAAKLSNIGLWYAGYTNHLKLSATKKSEIKAFSKILAIMFDENDIVLKTKIDRFFTKKGKFYFLDDEKILKGIKNRNELKKRIKEIESIAKFPANFKTYFNNLLKKFKEVKKVNFMVLEVDRESLEKLESLRDLFLLAEDSKIIVKDFNKFKKEAAKLGVFIKE